MKTLLACAALCIVSLVGLTGCSAMTQEADSHPINYGWPEPDTGASQHFG
jgi:hypothetical protein